MPQPRRTRPFRFLALLSGALTAMPVAAQSKKKDLTDPYTKGDQAAMAALGVASYGPLVWADDLRTEDVERVLGEERIRWIETRHFLIGSTLDKASTPQDSKARKVVNEDLAALNRRYGKLPKRSGKLSPWLRVHLYAHRAEALYDEFTDLVAHTDQDSHLGQEKKLLLLLFEKRSDLTRYADRFCQQKASTSLRHHHTRTNQRLLGLCAENDDGAKDEAVLYAQFRFQLMLNFCDAVGGMPYWLRYGLAHRFERQVPSNLMNCAPKENEHVDPATQNQWERKLSKRAEHDDLLVPFRTLCMSYDLGYHDHLQSWSRVEYLLATDAEQFRAFLRAVIGQTSQARQIQALRESYGVEPEEFDENWRAWIKKSY
jgi:hypothetical protein